SPRGRPAAHRLGRHARLPRGAGRDARVRRPRRGREPADRRRPRRARSASDGRMSTAANPSLILLERLERRAKQKGQAHRRHATLIVGAGILLFVIVVTLAAPLLTSYNPDSI